MYDTVEARFYWALYDARTSTPTIIVDVNIMQIDRRVRSRKYVILPRRVTVLNARANAEISIDV